MDNRLDDLWKKENPDSSEFTPCNIISDTRSWKERIYTGIKIAKNTKINQIMVPFTDHYHGILRDRHPSKAKIEKDYWYFDNSLSCKVEFSSTKLSFFY